MHMKKILALLLLVSLLITPSIPKVSAAEADESVIRFSDGSYILIETVVTESRSTSSKNASRYYTYYDLLDNEKWKVTLSASFTYTGSSATCTSSNVTVGISDSAWYIVSKSASKSTNVASCDVTMGYKFLGITTDKKTVHLTITCDANGNLT